MTGGHVWRQGDARGAGGPLRRALRHGGGAGPGRALPRGPAGRAAAVTSGRAGPSRAGAERQAPPSPAANKSPRAASGCTAPRPPPPDPTRPDPTRPAPLQVGAGGAAGPPPPASCGPGGEGRARAGHAWGGRTAPAGTTPGPGAREPPQAGRDAGGLPPGPELCYSLVCQHGEPWGARSLPAAPPIPSCSPDPLLPCTPLY